MKILLISTFLHPPSSFLPSSYLRENKNDESPKFSQDVFTPNIDEDAGPGTLVTTVIASDKDGDNILFGFVGGGTTSGMFHIEERTGVIRLINDKIVLDKDKYELNVTARDDGSCCKNGQQTLHTTTALVVVFITGKWLVLLRFSWVFNGLAASVKMHVFKRNFEIENPQTVVRFAPKTDSCIMQAVLLRSLELHPERKK